MFVATMLCLASLGQLPDGWTDVVRGAVVEKGTGRPIAGVSVIIDAGGVSPPKGVHVTATTATTDAQGRFEGLRASTGAAYVPRDGENGPRFRIRAEDDRVWPWTATGAENDRRGRGAPDPRAFAEHQLREVHEDVYDRQVESRWKGNGPAASLVVECPPVGAVEVVVRDPEGKPLADSPVVLVPTLEFSHTSQAIRFTGRTDATGTFRIHSFEGIRRFGVTVAGVGFGSTGPVEVVAGKTTRAEIPPLARFARVEGRLADSLKGPAAEVYAGGLSWADMARAAFAPVDAEGRFAIADVMPGDQFLGLRRDGRRVEIDQYMVRLGPGEVRRGVVLEPNPPTPPEDEKERQRTLQRLNGGDEKRTIAWVEGTVGDARGRPIADATIYVRVEYDAAMRIVEDVRKTTTDREGRYRIEGPFHRMMGTLSVVVTAKDRPPIVAYAPGPDSRLDPSELKPARLDVAVGAKGSGGALAVKVVRDDRPLPGARVDLTSAAGRARFGRTIAGESSAELRAIIVPSAVAGGDGVARFENLAPGAYAATATAPADPNRPFGHSRPQGTASGIDVPPGGKVEAVATLVPTLAPTRFRILGPDGAPVANKTVSMTLERNGGGAAGSFKTDDRGEGEHAFGLGLWTVDFRYRDTESKSFPIQGEPFYQAVGLVAVSPALAAAEPIELRAARVEPGSIRVRLLGLDGAPARGGVMILPEFNRPSQRAGSTDAQGWVRFPAAWSGTYHLRGFIDGASAPLRPGRGSRFSDDDLKNQRVIFDRQVSVEAGEETVVELRQEPASYVRVAIHAPEGRAARDYMVSVGNHWEPGWFWTREVSEDRSRHLFGPVPPGKRLVVVTQSSGNLANPAHLKQDVIVEPGRIVRVDLDAPPIPEPPAGEARPNPRSVRAFATGPDGATMTVVAADGETPAFGARALFIPANDAVLVDDGTADALGRLTWSGLRQIAGKRGETRPEPIKEPTVIVRGPDGAGPVVATLKAGEPPRLVLPAPNDVSGRVTIAGAAVAGDARIRVAIAAEGTDAVAEAMNRETVADADGRFRVVGLAPGRYVVQAVRDEIWTSKAVPLVVETGKDAPPIALDIPAPGATIALRLADRSGAAVAAGFSIKRPAGPLGDPTPIAGRTDARGGTILRGLATGVFELVVDGDATPHPLDVPPFRPGAAPFDVRVEVSRRGP